MGENYTIVGIRKVDYVSKKTNRPVKGYNLYCTYSSSNVDGLCAESVFVNLDCAGDYIPAVGDHIQVYYNRFGSVANISFLGNF